MIQPILILISLILIPYLIGIFFVREPCMTAKEHFGRWAYGLLTVVLFIAMLSIVYGINELINNAM